MAECSAWGGAAALSLSSKGQLKSRQDAGTHAASQGGLLAHKPSDLLRHLRQLAGRNQAAHPANLPPVNYRHNNAHQHVCGAGRGVGTGRLQQGVLGPHQNPACWPVRPLAAQKSVTSRYASSREPASKPGSNWENMALQPWLGGRGLVKAASLGPPHPSTDSQATASIAPAVRAHLVCMLAAVYLSKLGLTKASWGQSLTAMNPAWCAHDEWAVTPAGSLSLWTSSALLQAHLALHS